VRNPAERSSRSSIVRKNRVERLGKPTKHHFQEQWDSARVVHRVGWPMARAS
jgi:hypothetical protein